MRLLMLALLCSGCTASFQPFQPEVKREELAEAFKQRDAKILAIAQGLAKLQEKK